MKWSAAFALVAASGSAFVLPNEQVSNLRYVGKQGSQRVFDGDDSQHVSASTHCPCFLRSEAIQRKFDDITDDLADKYSEVSAQGEDRFHRFSRLAKEGFSSFVEHAEDKFNIVAEQVEEYDFEDDVLGLGSDDFQMPSLNAADVTDEYPLEEGGFDFAVEHPPHHGPPHHGPPHHGPHHPPHHKPNQTVYQLISSSKYTTKLAKLINKYDDIVEALNGTSANFTVFAPTDRAFEKIPEHAPKPSKEFLKALLSYHVSPDFYPASRIFLTRTIPTLLKSPSLGKKPLPQRLGTEIGFRGLTVNYYSRVVAANIFGTNGVIHGVDSILIPPPRALKIIDLVPSEFSTLELGLVKTGLFEKLNTTKHAGGTFFAPSNDAFRRLGPRINAFLFSEYGKKYLTALLKYHIVPNETLYSDAFYKASAEDGSYGDAMSEGIPKGFFHVDLPTLLEDHSLSVDVARYGRFIEIKVNGFTHVGPSDIVAYDGVIQVASSVLIPPKRLGDGSLNIWDDTTELTEAELKQRLAPMVKTSPLLTDL